MDALARQLGFEEGDRSGWYKIRNRTLLDNGGAGILQTYNNSLLSLLEKVYPEEKWDPLQFNQAPRNYWYSLDNQRSFLIELSAKFGFKENDMEAWYGVTNRKVMDHGGGGLLDMYRGSLPDLLVKVFPSFQWKRWKFVGRTGVMKDPQLLNAFVNEMETVFNIKSHQDWNRVSQEDLIKLGAGRVIDSSPDGLAGILKLVYPDESWDRLIALPKRASQAQ